MKRYTYLILACLSLFSLTASAQIYVPTTPQNRGALIESFMGIYGVYCPDASKRGDDIRALNPNVHFVEFHTGIYATPMNATDIDLRTTIGDDILPFANIVGYPTGPVNRKLFPGETTTALSRGKWLTYTSNITSSPSPVNLAVDGYYDAGTGKLMVSVAAYYTSTVSTPQYLNVYLVQDNIVGTQQGGATHYPARVLPGGDYVHKDVFRDALTGLWGVPLTGTTSGNRIDKFFTYTPATINGIPYVPGDMKLIAFISGGSGYSEIVTAAKDDSLGTGPSTAAGYSISGTTMMGGDTTIKDMRRVYLIQQDTNYSVPFLYASDSVDTQGEYEFTGLTAGTYYLKVALLPGAPNYSNYLPSYHWQQTLWSNANQVTITNASVVGKFIDLIPGSNPGGPGFIGGLVSAGANLTEGDPMPGVTVLLFDTLDKPLAFSVTDQDGKYAFPNLAYGVYEIYVDFLNKTATPMRVEISPENPGLENSDFSVNGDDITFTGIEKASSFYRELSVYPNPTEGQLFLEVSVDRKTTATLSLMNVLGSEVYTGNVVFKPGANKIDLSGLKPEPGVYFLRIKSDASKVTRRLVFN